MSSAASELPLKPSDIVLPSLGGYISPAGSLQGVTFWPRVGARLIDNGAHYFIGYAAGRLFGKILVIASGGHVPRAILFKMRHPGPYPFIFAVLGFVAYQVIFTAIHGGTIGKRLLSMVVVQEDGSPCTFASAVVRELAYFVDALFFGLIGYTAMHDDEKQQRHGDDWAHTIVCQRARIPQGSLKDADRFVMALLFAIMTDIAFLMIGLLVPIMR